MQIGVNVARQQDRVAAEYVKSVSECVCVGVSVWVESSECA